MFWFEYLLISVYFFQFSDVASSSTKKKDFTWIANLFVKNYPNCRKLAKNHPKPNTMSKYEEFSQTNFFHWKFPEIFFKIRESMKGYSFRKFEVANLQNFTI
jgi:hypothetical protein